MNRQFSKEEAERIFALAAERQHAKSTTEENLLTIEDLEEAGLAAGINPEYIRAAASDILRPDRMTFRRDFLGLPVEFRESHVLPLAFEEANWNKAVGIFADVYNRAGKTIDAGAARRWSSEENENQMPAHVIAEIEEHGTRFTIERKTWPMTLGFGLGAAIMLLVGLIFFVVGFTVPAAHDLILPAYIVTSIALLFGAGSAFGLKMFGLQELKRFEQIFDRLERLGDEQRSDLNLPAAISQTEAVNKPLIDIDEEPGENFTGGRSKQSSRTGA